MDVLLVGSPPWVARRTGERAGRLAVDLDPEDRAVQTDGERIAVADAIGPAHEGSTMPRSLFFCAAMSLSQRRPVCSWTVLPEKAPAFAQGRAGVADGQVVREREATRDEPLLGSDAQPTVSQVMHVTPGGGNKWTRLPTYLDQ
ncbi:hypothetical protein GCM10023080_088510 [Streptomyces pseudoechinosporeus]